MMLRTQKRVFTIMVAGYRGLGKSSFVNTLFDQVIIPTCPKQSDKASMNLYVLDVSCEGVRRNISIIDSPGFGHYINDTKTHQNIENYIRSQFDAFLAEETKIRRNPHFEDNRVHTLIYFISPNPHGLSQNDIAFLKTVDNLVNIIPVVGKADGLTAKELDLLRFNVMRQIKENSISVFDFERDSYDVVGSSESFKGRKKHWGVVNINDPKYCDFSLLKEILLSSYMDVLVEKTASDLYEEYRATVLPQILPDTLRE
ncbi:UNVERIFIED_CONTAM: hypothetical protein PYX00_011865 [Menopon gallinae]|uniref:Septin-type G domain-containing protein n=1 Tax=Menopon gallinae TaxID=328185 RepID=A0AAW2H8W9_9NEOP